MGEGESSFRSRTVQGTCGELHRAQRGWGIRWYVHGQGRGDGEKQSHGQEGGAATDSLQGSEHGPVIAPVPSTHTHLGDYNSPFPEDMDGASLPSRSLESTESRQTTNERRAVPRASCFSTNLFSSRR